MREANPNSTGYTLLELLVVLAILGLVATLAAPAANYAVEAATLRGDSRKLASELLHLQHLAAQKQITISIMANPELRVYGAAQFTPSRDETLVFAQGTDELDYYPDGTTSGGTIRVVEPHGAMFLKVAWLTGAVSVARNP